MVKVLVFGQVLQDAVEEPEFECEVSHPITVRELFETHTERFEPFQSFLDSNQVMMTINLKISTFESKVKDGDTLKLTHQFNPELEGARWHNP
ncbi:MAG: MoaD/ThiS family protein [Nitrospirales bacterium]|nr:MoaD/ThiS family protein [Nitrospira sp.]MDR4503046.1 MoaD/ThiS family protein [Nitrospirales bacterium]